MIAKSSCPGMNHPLSLESLVTHLGFTHCFFLPLSVLWLWGTVRLAGGRVPRCCFGGVLPLLRCDFSVLWLCLGHPCKEPKALISSSPWTWVESLLRFGISFLPQTCRCLCSHLPRKRNRTPHNGEGLRSKGSSVVDRKTRPKKEGGGSKGWVCVSPLPP